MHTEIVHNRARYMHKFKVAYGHRKPRVNVLPNRGIVQDSEIASRPAVIGLDFLTRRAAIGCVGETREPKDLALGSAHVHWNRTFAAHGRS